MAPNRPPRRQNTKAEVSGEAHGLPDSVPGWAVEEVLNPLAMGEGRNNQMIRVGPTLLRNGVDEDQLLEIFLEMYPDLNEGQVAEVEAVVRNAVKLADHDGMMTTSEFIKQKEAMARITHANAKALPKILIDYAWTVEEIREAGGMGAWMGREARSVFLTSLFALDAVIWTGAVWQTGLRKDRAKRIVGNWADRFQTIDAIIRRPLPSGEFCSHCTFQPGTYSRCDEAVVNRGYLVVESDVLQLDQVGAVFNYLVAQGLHLRAIVSTGGKSLHGWFDWPEGRGLSGLQATLIGLSCDPATTRASQPVRLPGIIRQNTGRMQELLYLDPPAKPIS